MSNWDDEEYEVPVAAVSNSFDDEDDDGVLESWEAAGDSDEESQTVAAPTRKKVPAYIRAAEREAKEQEEREKAAMKAGEEDPAAKKERLKQLEIENDLNSAAALFGEASLHPREKAAAAKAAQSSFSAPAGPVKLSDLAIFKPTNKSEFDSLRKTLAPLVAGLNEKKPLLFGDFVTSFVRDTCKPLSSAQVQKVVATLNALSNEKAREERMNRGGKKKKPIVKDVSAKIDETKDTTNYGDLDDDDFM